MALLNYDYFIFDGHSSNEFGLQVCSFDTNDTWGTGLNVDLKRGENNMVRTERNLYGAVYTETLVFEIGVIPRYNREFTPDESRSINNWLRRSNTYQLLHFNSNDPEHINFYAVCTNIEDKIFGCHAGKQITFTCNSPFGFMAPISRTFNVKDGEYLSQKFFNLSDNGIYYPIMTITAPEDFMGVVAYESVTDENSGFLDFKGVEAKDGKRVVILDGQHNTVKDADGKLISGYKIGWNNTTNIYWFRLLPGTNLVRFIGENVTFKITCEFPRKVGAV